MILNTFNQRGVGLVEVLVALLLLSIGVLGFAVLQIRALDASIEATKDIETEDKDGKKALYKAYVQAFSGKDSISSYTYQKCFNSSAGCSSEIFAQEDANQVLYKAYQMGMKVGLSECNSSTALQRTRYCIYIAWDETNPKDGSDSKDCTNDGSYRFDSKCILMEIY